MKIRVNLTNLRCSCTSQASITTYYDSNPFDYRDLNFLHEDGTPAHFGDVVELLSGSITPIRITTAGWNEGNVYAERAASKIVSLFQENPSILSMLRISVNATERIARTNLPLYEQSIQEVLQALYCIHPLLLVFDDKSQPLYTDVVTRLQEMFNLRVQMLIVSQYSGRNNNNRKEGDYDVMACMHGYHIWPDGTLCWQKPANTPIYDFTAEKGSRPTPMSHRFW